MAAIPLTADERTQVRNYLGWSERFHQTDSRLEVGLNALDADETGLTLVRAEMAKIVVIEGKIQNLTTLFKVSKVGTIGVEGAQALMLHRNLARSSIARISIAMGVEVRADYFGTSGARGMATRHGLFPSGEGLADNLLRQG